MTRVDPKRTPFPGSRRIDRLVLAASLLALVTLGCRGADDGDPSVDFAVEPALPSAGAEFRVVPLADHVHVGTAYELFADTIEAHFVLFPQQLSDDGVIPPRVERVGEVGGVGVLPMRMDLPSDGDLLTMPTSLAPGTPVRLCVYGSERCESFDVGEEGIL